MTTEKHRIIEILDLINDELFRAWLCLEVAREVKKNSGTLQADRINYVLTATFYGCMRETLLTLAKLIVQHPKSISFPYLANYAEQNPSEFPQASEAAVRKLCTEARQ